MKTKLTRQLALFVIGATASAAGLAIADDIMLDTSKPLRLEQALGLALTHNPELVASSHGTRAAEARVRRARAIPNPEIELEVEGYDRDGAGSDSAEAAIVLGQAIELGGKRSGRRRAAQAEAELAEWDYQRKRRAVVAETMRRFAAVLASVRRLALAETMVDLASQTSTATEERVKAGKEPPLQASKASAEADMARMEARAARNGLDVARLRLAVMWGSREPRFNAVEGDLQGVPTSIPSLADLRTRLPDHPELARRDAGIRLSEAALRSERAARIPDLHASIGFQRYEEDDTDALAFGVGVPIPIFDRGNVAAARHDRAQAEALRRAATTAIEAELADGHARLASAHDRALTLRDSVVPALQAAFDASREGFRQGKFGFLDMLDAQRSLFEANAQLVDALEAYRGAAAGIFELTGLATEEATENGKPQRVIEE